MIDSNTEYWKQRVVALNTELETKKVEIRALDDELNTLNLEANSYLEEAAERKADATVAQAATEILIVENGHLRYDLGRAEGLVDDLQCEIDGLMEKRDELRHLVDHRTAQVNSFTAKVENQEAIIEYMVDDMNRKDTAIADLHETISRLNSEVIEYKDDVERMVATIDRQADAYVDMQVRIGLLMSENQRLKYGRIDATAEQQVGAEMVEHIIDAIEAAGYEVTGSPC